eukprot:308473_1
MSRFSRIFQRVVQISTIPSLTTLSALTINKSSVNDKKEEELENEEECETPICHDAEEAIKEYSYYQHPRRRSLLSAPDRGQLGRHSWTLLHVIAAYWSNNPTKEKK